jgi:hypothetical protein
MTRKFRLLKQKQCVILLKTQKKKYFKKKLQKCALLLNNQKNEPISGKLILNDEK